MALIACPRCNGQLDAPILNGETVPCPYCGQPLLLDVQPVLTPVRPPPSVSRSRRKRQDAMPSIISACVALAVTFSLCGGCWLSFSEWRSKPKAPVTIEQELMRLAENAVKLHLNYPDNAKFHWFPEVQLDADGYYVVRGKVDAMNAFGAKPTHRYTAKFALVSKGPPRQFELTHIRIGDQSYEYPLATR